MITPHALVSLYKYIEILHMQHTDDDPKLTQEQNRRRHYLVCSATYDAMSALSNGLKALEKEGLC